MPEDTTTSEERATPEETVGVGLEPGDVADSPTGRLDTVPVLSGHASEVPIPKVPMPEVLAQPDQLAGPPGDDPDLLGRVATAIGDIFEDDLATIEDPVDGP